MQQTSVERAEQHPGAVPICLTDQLSEDHTQHPSYGGIAPRTWISHSQLIALLWNCPILRASFLTLVELFLELLAIQSGLVTNRWLQIAKDTQFNLVLVNTLLSKEFFVEKSVKGLSKEVHTFQASVVMSPIQDRTLDHCRSTDSSLKPYHLSSASA